MILDWEYFCAAFGSATTLSKLFRFFSPQSLIHKTTEFSFSTCLFMAQQVWETDFLILYFHNTQHSGPQNQVWSCLSTLVQTIIVYSAFLSILCFRMDLGHFATFSTLQGYTKELMWEKHVSKAWRIDFKNASYLHRCLQSVDMFPTHVVELDKCAFQQGTIAEVNQLVLLLHACYCKQVSLCAPLYHHI